MLDFLD